MVAVREGQIKPHIRSSSLTLLPFLCHHVILQIRSSVQSQTLP